MSGCMQQSTEPAYIGNLQRDLHQSSDGFARGVARGQKEGHGFIIDVVAVSIEVAGRLRP